MFCPKCGSELREGTIFCHNCGQKLRNTNPTNKDITTRVQEIKDTVSNAAGSFANTAKAVNNNVNNISEGKAQAFTNKAKETVSNVSDSMKTFGKKVNEATDGKAQAFTNKAKETARDFTNDINQTTKDKDIRGFFTKNKYRNTKIVICLVVILIVFGNVFGVGGSMSNSKAKKIIMADIKERFPTKDIKLKEFYKLGKLNERDCYAVHYTIDWNGLGNNDENRYCRFELENGKITVKYEGAHNMKQVKEDYNIVKSESEKK